VPEPTVRPRRAGDLPGLVEVLRAVHTRDGYPTVWPLDPAAWLDPPGLLQAWVAESSGVVVAHGALKDDADGARWVSRLFTDPAVRGSGAAGALLDVAVAASGPGLLLDVVDDAAGAIGFYEHRGWRLLERRAATWRNARGASPLVRVYAAPVTGRVSGQP
jgi:GNAT superfamily N-acetyltransferase